MHHVFAQHLCNGVLKFFIFFVMDCHISLWFNFRNGVTPKSHQSKHHRELNMTYIAFGIVVLFFCLNTPRIVIGAYEVSETW